MAIGVPYAIGTATLSGAQVLYITSGVDTQKGDIIIVCTDSDFHSFSTTVVSVQDSVGNVYAWQASSPTLTNPYGEVWASQNSLPLPASGVITVSWGTSGNDVNATAIGCSGVASSSALDQETGVLATPSTGTITLTTPFPLGLANELGVAFWCSRNAIGPPSITSGWASLATVTGAANTHYDNIAAMVATNANPVSAAATIPNTGTGISGQGWFGMLLMFRGVLVVKATGSIGGSSTAFPVSAVTGAANGTIGISAAEPAGLAPFNPPVLPAFPAGYTPLPADFTQWVQQSLGYCTQRIVFRATATSGQSLPAGAWTILAFTNVIEDPFDGWNPDPSSGQPLYSWTAPWTGVYEVTFRYTVSPVAAWLDAGIAVTTISPAYEGEGTKVPSTLPGGAGGTFTVAMIGGTDYVQLLARSSVNATTNASSAGVSAYVEITPVQTAPQG